MSTEAHTAGRESIRRDFPSFFGEGYPRLVRALYLLTADVAEAEDIAQEAMVRTFERWDRVQSMESPTGYVYRVAMRLNHRLFRRLRLQGRKPPPPPAAPADPAIVAQARSDVMRALSSLSGGQREALVLHELLGMDTDEVARALGIEPVSVRARLHRARAAMREALGAEYE